MNVIKYLPLATTGTIILLIFFSMLYVLRRIERDEATTIDSEEDELSRQLLAQYKLDREADDEPIIDSEQHDADMSRLLVAQYKLDQQQGMEEAWRQFMQS